MNKRQIRENIYWIGVVDWDRRLFDSLIPLPDGTTYNAYLIEGRDKTVLIDTVDLSMADAWLRQFENISSVDYIVSQHSEQDHSGAIDLVLQKFPNAKVICTPKAKLMLIDLLGISEEVFITVSDGETLSLGDKTLRFIHTPWVHWPETMVTYLEEDKILFSCDFFGSHIATTDLFVTHQERVHEAAKRYFAEIMMPFRTVIAKNLEKLAPYDIRLIAPSHGQIFDTPGWIIKAYHQWVLGDLQNLVVLPYVSMHDSTRKMVDHLIAALVKRGVRVEPFNLVVTDIGKLAMALVDAGTLIVGTPTVLTGPHPLAAYATFLANALRPKAKFISVIGSFGWGGKTVEILAGMIPNLKVEVLPPVLCKGRPTAETFAALDALADTVDIKHRHERFEAAQ